MMTPLAPVHRWLPAIAFLFGLSLTSAATPWPGDVDLSFDPGSSIDGWVHAVVKQSDGKILIGGDFDTIDGEPRKGIARFHPDGTVDSTFIVPGLRPYPIVTSIIRQPDGKILVGGSFYWGSNEDPRYMVARLDPDGTIDPTFEGAQVLSDVRSMALQTDGKILIGGGFSVIADEVRNGIARLNADGTLDETFGAGMAGIGHDAADSSGPPPEVMSVALQADGKVLIGGYFASVNGEPRNNIARLNSDGTLDESFGHGLSGTAFPEIPAALDLARVQSIVIQEDGKILLGGNFTMIHGERRNRIVRLHADGSLDHTFGAGLAGADDWVQTIALLHDGKILIGGWFGSVNGKVRNGIARLNADGTLDDSFGRGQTGANTWVQAVVPQENEKVLIGGVFTSVNGVALDRIARLYGGSPPPNEPPTDILLSSSTIVENTAIGKTVAVLTAADSNERLPHIFSFVSGEGDTENASFTIEGNELKTATLLDHEEQEDYSARIRATDAGGLSVEKSVSLAIAPSPADRPWPGDLDPSFAPASPINGTVRAMVPQEDGKWIIAGDFTSVAGTARGRIARLHADGSLDQTFMNGLTGANGSIESVAIQPGGTILISGTFSMINSNDRRGFARLRRDGSLDEIFELNGWRSPAIALQDDGRILVASHGVARWNRVGYDDIPFIFGIDSDARADGPARALALQSDGSILLGGNFTTVGGQPRAGIARLNPNGALDDSFQADIPGDVHGIAVQSDRKIVISGRLESGTGGLAFGLARLNPDGTTDTTFRFGTTGQNQIISSIALQSNGQILIAGDFTSINEEMRNRIARLNADGTIDESFSVVSTGPDGAIHSVTLQNDGGIMIAGEFNHVNGVPRSRIARLHGGSLPPQDLLLSKQTIREGLPAGATVGSLSAIDLNRSQAHSFTLVAGEGDEGNPLFTIDTDTLNTNVVFDSAIRNSYPIRVRMDTTDGLWAKRNFIITVEPDRYLTWAEQLPEGQRAETDDAGGFGIMNLLRYASGMAALQPEREKLPRIGQVVIMDDGQPQMYLTLTYTRRTDDDSLIYIAEASDDLVSWLPFTGTEEIADDGNGETETVTVRDAEPIEDNTTRFLRLRVEQ